MINLKPLIETFKKAIYGRDVRQSIVDLAQAIGKNHNEQETLRNEVKALNADTKEENRQGKEYITSKKAEMDNAITTGKASIENTVSTGKAAVDRKISEAVSSIGTKTTEGEQALSAKTQSGISSLEQKTTQSTQAVEAVISRANESKTAVEMAITKAGESKTSLENTIKQSESGKTSLDSTIQQSTAKDKELENHIAEINKIIADGKAVTKEELKEEILKLKGLSIEVLDTIPQTGKAGVIYFIKATAGSEQNLFDEYAWVNDKWEMIGSKSIDLSQYATVESVDELETNVYTYIGELDSTLSANIRNMEKKFSNYPTFEQVKPQITTFNCGGFTWYLQIEPIKGDKSFRLTAYCEFKPVNHESEIYRDSAGYNSLQILEFSSEALKIYNDLNLKKGVTLFHFFSGCISFNIVENQQVFALNPRILLDSSRGVYIQWEPPKDPSGEEYLNFIIRTEAYI